MRRSSRRRRSRSRSRSRNRGGDTGDMSYEQYLEAFEKVWADLRSTSSTDQGRACQSCRLCKYELCGVQLRKVEKL